MPSDTPYPYQPTIPLAPAAAYSGTYWQIRHTNGAGCRKKYGRRAQSRWHRIISSGLALRPLDRTHKDETGARASETTECTIFPWMTASVRSTDPEPRQPRRIPSTMNLLAVQNRGPDLSEFCRNFH